MPPSRSQLARTAASDDLTMCPTVGSSDTTRPTSVPPTRIAAEADHPRRDGEDDAERAELLGVLLHVRLHHQAGAAAVQHLDDAGEDGT